MRSNLTRVIALAATLFVAGAGLSGCVTYDPYPVPVYNAYDPPWYGYGWHGYWGGYGWDHHAWETWRRDHPWVNSPRHAWAGPLAHTWTYTAKPFHRG